MIAARQLVVLTALLLAAAPSAAQVTMRAPSNVTAPNLRVPIKPTCLTAQEAAQLQALQAQQKQIAAQIAIRKALWEDFAAKRDALKASLSDELPADVAAARQNQIVIIETKMAALANANETAQAQLDAITAQIAAKRGLPPCKI